MGLCALLFSARGLSFHDTLPSVQVEDLDPYIITANQVPSEPEPQKPRLWEDFKPYVLISMYGAL